MGSEAQRINQQRYRRTEKGHEVSIKYRHSKRGVISTAYTNIKNRVKGKRLHHINYIGLEVEEREDFVQWANKSKKLAKLHKDWVLKDYEYKYTPSVDRLNPNLGYTLDNMDWCTISENTKRMHQMKKVR